MLVQEQEESRGDLTTQGSADCPFVQVSRCPTLFSLVPGQNGTVSTLATRHLLVVREGAVLCAMLDDERRGSLGLYNAYVERASHTIDVFVQRQKHTAHRERHRSTQCLARLPCSLHCHPQFPTCSLATSLGAHRAAPQQASPHSDTLLRTPTTAPPHGLSPRCLAFSMLTATSRLARSR